MELNDGFINGVMNGKLVNYLKCYIKIFYRKQTHRLFCLSNFYLSNREKKKRNTCHPLYIGGN